MGKFVGWKCDVCNNAENGNDAPEDWLRLRLPSNGADNTRDFCSDKCLLKFARQRVGGGTTTVTRRQGKSDPRLVEFLHEQGVRNSSIGGVIGTHVRRRHELIGTVDDCLVCQWMTSEKGE